MYYPSPELQIGPATYTGPSMPEYTALGTTALFTLSPQAYEDLVVKILTEATEYAAQTFLAAQ